MFIKEKLTNRDAEYLFAISLLFIEEFEKLLRMEVGKIIAGSSKLSYRQAIEYQIVLLIKAIENDSPKDYIPFEIDM